MGRIGIKYCGNCNPHVDCPGLVRKMAQLGQGLYEFVPHSQGNIDLLLILSACPSDCATRPDFSGPTIEVAGATVECYPVEEGEQAEKILSRIKEKLGE